MSNPTGPQQPAWGGGPPPTKQEAKAQAAAARAYAKSNRNWFARHKILTGVAALIAVIVAVSAGSGGGGTSPSANNTPAANDQANAVTSEPPAATKAPAKPAETSGQRNAKRAAANYLSISAFSRAGLIRQLSSSAGDGYSAADATYGVDAQHADWNQQAYKAAKSYLSISSFSRAGLIRQLESSAGDKYTHAQAVYGTDKALAE